MPKPVPEDIVETTPLTGSPQAGEPLLNFLSHLLLSDKTPLPDDPLHFRYVESEPTLIY